MSGAFDHSFGDDFDVGSSTVLHLVLTLSIDDHPRPPHNLWRRYGYPNSQVALGLIQATSVVDVLGDIPIEIVDKYDEILAGGHEVYLASDSWEAAVLQANGYTLEEVPA